MTHSLHRLGTRENLRNDYPLICMAAHGINEEGAAAKMGRFLEICQRHGPINLGDMKQGNIFVHDAGDIIKNITNTTLVQVVFDDPAKVEAVLRDLVAENFDLSVVVSGLTDATSECCRKVGLEVHTVSQSLGVRGNISRLPSRAVLEITTMCGHGMTASGLVEQMIEDIKKGRTTPEKAAVTLAKPCECGIFNTTRAATLLAAAAAQ